VSFRTAGARFGPLLLLAVLAGCPERLPSVPERALGPDSLLVGAEGRFRFYSLPGRSERIAYVVNWQDGDCDTTQFFRGGDTLNLAHAWSEDGFYDIMARALSEEGLASEWAEAKHVVVFWTNDPPLVPDDSGPDTLVRGVDGQFRTRTADPEQDLLTYVFDWGDGTGQELGGYSSGSACRVLHSWPDAGRFVVRVKARDEHGAESSWTFGHEVVVLPAASRDEGVNGP
jgi:hypothetical protein